MTPVDAAVLRLVREHLLNAETRVFDHVTTTFRWLMAALFAANGGGIVALLESSPATLQAHMASLICFACGLLSSILMGILSTLWGHWALIRMTTTRFKVDQSLIENVTNQEILTDLAAEKPTWKTWVPSYAGFASFFCLIVGMLMVGWHI